MHILILPSWYTNSYNPLLGIFFKEQAEALVKYNNQVGVISIQEIAIQDIIKEKKIDFSKKIFTENGVYTYRLQYPAIPKLHSIRRKINFFLFPKLFEAYIGKYGLPDIVHVHSFMSGELAMWIKEKYNIPYITTEHFSGFKRDTISSKNLLLAKKVFENSDYNIAVSNEFTILLKNKFNQDFHYIPNIVNIDYFNLKSKKTNENFEFINVAFLDKKKNQDMLIKSFSKTFKNLVNIKLTIVGNGSEYKNLKQLIKKLNMENQITLYGRANRKEVKELLQSSDAFVLTSKYETFGVVLVEAMACGLPVISTKSGGPESIIVTPKVGLLVDINENNLSDALDSMYRNIEKYNSNYIRQYVKDNFSEKAVCIKLEKIYEKVLNK